MPYELACDTCDFERDVDRESAAYADAKDHEAEHPEHFVFITTIQE